ncbi:hypothetical protein BG015_004157 [Linnemannia schmuckeri]|uniref:Uncharacterized protein n=1 Tax=Linnemannia schmuckeri TaxID=64567 RepID=A0A9P5VFW5_9FUNG|nr:hypothetical protein BG015_004157 [Linnemannia schmuckeri]
MLAHNKPQASTTSELLNLRPLGNHRHTTPQLQSTQHSSSSLLPQSLPRQERPKRKISHRELAPASRTATADSRLLSAHVDHIAAPTTGTGLSHQSKHIDSQEPMTPTDSRTHLNGTYLQRPPSFEPFGIHRQDQQQRQEPPQRGTASAEIESNGKITEDATVRDQNIDPRHNGTDTADSNKYQVNLGRPAMDHRSKRSPAVVGGGTKHGDDLDGRTIASSTTTTSLFGRSATEKHRDIPPSQHIQRNTSQPMTIRDIVDSEELRNQLAELHRSLNSNPDPHPPQYTSSAQAQRRPSNQPSPKYPQALSSTAQADCTGPRRGLRDDSVANDLAMDTSLLEKKFRARLEADIQVMEAPQEHQHTMDNGRATASSNIHESDYRKLLPSERQRRELYSSSYSPSNFSSVEEIDERIDNDDDEDDEEEQNTVELKGSNISRIVQTPPLSQPQQQRPLNPTSSLNQRRMEPAERRNNDRLPDTGYESGGEFSFHREVARARARRELGASQDNGLARSNGVGGPGVKASKLDHGRDLALEDLASPVRYDFEETQGGQHPLRTGEQPISTVEQGPRRRPESHYPTMTPEEEMERLNMVTKAEDRFMELAGSMGEGQAVSSLLETLKGMIRKLKSEKRSSMSTVKGLKKDLKQAQQELRRTRKANEKLSKVKQSTSSHRNGSKHDRDTTQDLENATLRPRRNQSLEEKEQERKNAAIQREKDRAERDLRAVQKQLDVLEKQKEAMQKRERLRAEEEANLLFLIESDSDDEDEEEEDSESESESESDSDDEDSFRILSESAASGYSNREIPLVDARARRGSKAKRRSSSTGTSAAKGKEVQRHRTGIDTHRARDRTKLTTQIAGSRSKSAHPDTRHPVDNVEEVHIHHHVYYGDADMEDIPNIRPRIIQARLHHSTSRLDGRFADRHEDAHRLNIGSGHRINDAGFGFYRRGSPHQLERSGPSKSMLSRSFPGQRMHASQHFEAPTEEMSPLRPHPRRQQTAPDAVNWEGHGSQGIGSPVPAHKDGEAYPLYRPGPGPGPQVISTTQGSARMVTRVQHGFSLRSAGTHELTVPLKDSNSQRKKISIDLKRILSLLKTHDPRRCTVCCSGGDGRDHSTHHQDDQQLQFSRPAIKIDGRPVLIQRKASVTTTRSATVQQSSSSSRLDRHVGQINDGYRDVLSDSESSVSSISDSEARRGKGTARNDSRGHGAGVGGQSYPARQRRSQSQPPQATETGIDNTNNDHNDDDDDDEQHPPEWKLHVTLCKLDKEVQQLRKSHLDLSGKLERLGSSSNLQPASSTAAVADETGTLSLEKQEKKRQQRRQLRLQLQRVVDSLEEKAEEILSLQHYLLEQQQQQQENPEQSESAVSESSRLTRNVRKPSTVTVEDDVGQDSDDLNVGERQVSGNRELRMPERFKHRTINGS